jgi:hypothetical protein
VTSTAVPDLDQLEVLRSAIQRAIPWLAAQSSAEAAEAVGEELMIGRMRHDGQLLLTR